VAATPLQIQWLQHHNCIPEDLLVATNTHYNDTKVLALTSSLAVLVKSSRMQTSHLPPALDYFLLHLKQISLHISDSQLGV
jgi:hypothetical protein